MSIHLSPDTEALVEKTLSSGRYGSADDVVRVALHLLDEQERFLNLHNRDLRGQIQEGYDSLRRGEGLDGEAVFEELRSELEALENLPQQ